METNANKFVSADGHVVEPANLWIERMDFRFRERAPRIDSKPDNDYYLIDGLPPSPAGLEGVIVEEKISGKIERPLGQRVKNTRPGAWDPKARMADQELDNITAEVIYPGLFGLQFFNVEDAEYQRECMRVYNDWLSEFCAAAPQRLLGAGLLPFAGPVEWAMEEARRVAKKGLRTLLIPAEVRGRMYAAPEYEKLWSALEELNLPVGTHAGTGTGEALSAKVKRLGLGMAVTDSKIMQPMRALADLIWAGVPQRHPKLRFVIVEGGIGWIASLLRFMDHWWSDHRHWMQPHLDESPGTYFRRQFWATFEDDRPGLLTRELLGVDRLMWGSDYPHTEGTFPKSREQIEQDFAGIPQREVRAMVANNAARLYGVG